MTPAATQAVLTLILGIIAVCTFLLKGRQWPTFITACLFGMFAGSTAWGSGLMGWCGDLVRSIIQSMSS
jgi:hypothetical protein